MSQQIKCKCKVICNLWKLIINWRTLSGKITKTSTVLPDEQRWVLCIEFKGSSSSAKGLLMRQKAYPRGHWNNTEQQPRDYFIYFICYFAYQHWKLPHCKLATKKWRLINGENEGKQSNLINKKIGKQNSSCLNKLPWEPKVLTSAAKHHRTYSARKLRKVPLISWYYAWQWFFHWWTSCMHEHLFLLKSLKVTKVKPKLNFIWWFHSINFFSGSLSRHFPAEVISGCTL